MILIICGGIRRSSWVCPAAGHGTKSVLAADPVAPGECARSARSDPSELWLVDVWMDSHQHAPSAVTLDIDDTVDVVHGRQQLSLFNAYYEHCFLPIHVYDPARSRPVAVILRPGKVPSGVEMRAHLRRLVRRIRRRWPDTRITFRATATTPAARRWREDMFNHNVLAQWPAGSA
jgi:hypothetical protein